MISDERLNELEQVEGLADLVAEVRRLRGNTCPRCGRPVQFQGMEHAVCGIDPVEAWSIQQDALKRRIADERSRIANQVEEKVGPVFGPTLAKMIREL